MSAELIELEEELAETAVVATELVVDVVGRVVDEEEVCERLVAAR